MTATLQMSQDKIKKIKETKTYQEQFAKEWAKCTVNPDLIPVGLFRIVRYFMERNPYQYFINLGLPFETWETLRYKPSSEWDINIIKIGINFAFQVTELDCNMVDDYYCKYIRDMVTLNNEITKMFIECEQRCINMCSLTIR